MFDMKLPLTARRLFEETISEFEVGTDYDRNFVYFRKLVDYWKSKGCDTSAYEEKAKPYVKV